NEEAKEAAGPAAPAGLTSSPVECLGAGKWRIQGLYEHQLLKLGLRRLDAEELWSAESFVNLLQLPSGLFRERLLRDLLSGEVRLQSVLPSDIAAAQWDLRQLGVRQLLRLRVQHLDFIPSGCGSNSVTAVGNTHEAFLATLDSLVFQQLGRHAVSSQVVAPLKNAEAYSLGREAVLMAAAATAITETPFWSWWINGQCRVFFNAPRFECTSKFPGNGGKVLEVTDLSKADHQEPTGKLRWLDWSVNLISSEADLLRAPQGSSEHASEAPVQRPASFTFLGPGAAASSAARGGAAAAGSLSLSPAMLLEAR
ncbi:unnamed protein product, partial [Polarella glacialis]